jgi:hypothetical protein
MTHANSRQVGGNHYSAPVQHWDIAAVYLLGHFEGNITKYISRHAKKNKAQDVEKALHYLEKLIELFVHGQIQPVHLDYPNLPGRNANGVNPVQQWCTDMELPNDETMIVNKMCLWRTHVDLVRVRSLINAIMARDYANQDTRGLVEISRNPFPLPEIMSGRGVGISHAADQRDPDMDGMNPGPGYVNQDREQTFVHTSTGLPLDDHYGGEFLPDPYTQTR